MSPPPLSLSPSISLAAARPQGAVKWLLMWLNRIWKEKKKLSHPLFVLFFVSLSHSLGHVVLTLTENRPKVVDFKRNQLLKQRRKKSGPPCRVDFKRELTSSVLTSRGFHCIFFFYICSLIFFLRILWTKNLQKKSKTHFCHVNRVHFLPRVCHVFLILELFTFESENVISHLNPTASLWNTTFAFDLWILRTIVNADFF